MSTKTRTAIDRAADDVKDEEVDGLPDIKAIIDSLKGWRTVHAAAVSAMMDSQRKIAEFQALAVPYERQISESQQTQANVAIGCVHGDTEAQRKWSDADVAIEAALRFLRQHQLAMPAFEMQTKQSPSHVAKAASEVNQLELDLAKARLTAKLEIARIRLTQ